MKTAIIPILSTADVAALSTCAAELAAIGVKRLWLLHNPSLGVTNDSIVKSYDDRITLIREQQRSAAAREDYDAAKNFKAELESVQVERETAVRNGWRNVPESDRNRAYDAALAPLLNPKQFTDGISITTLREDYQPNGVFGMLQGLLATWPAEVPHGEFSLIWPRNCTAHEKQKLPEVDLRTSEKEVLETARNISAIAKSAEPIPSDLSKLTYMQAQQLAKQLGIDAHRKKLPEVIDLIRAKQSEAVAA